jgi:hypothetical protein
MKHTLFIILALIFIGSGFSQENKTSDFLVELNSGYSIGINLPSAMPIELKLVYPFSRFGFTVEGGTFLLFEESPGYHIFFGPTFFVINNQKIRIPISLGVDITGYKNNLYLGAGGIVSFNYSLSKYLYAGINIEVNYDFISPYDKIIGYKDAAIGVDEGGNKIYPIDSKGNPIKTTPITEKKYHFDNNIYLKPTIAIGMQF